MKKLILTLCILCLMFLVSVFVYLNKEEYKTYKIIKVLEADTFYIDINENNTPEEDEIFHIKNIIALKPNKNSKTEYYAQKLQMPIEDYLKVGYLARELAKQELTNKEISILIPKNNQKYADIYYNGKNLAEILLKDGLAFVYEKSDNPEYFQFQNIKQIKANAKELSVLDFSLVNLKTNIAHNTDSEHFSLIRNGELFLKKQLKYLGFVFCKSCDKEYSDKSTEKIDISELKSKNKYLKSISKRFGNIELFLINPYERKKPDSSCSTQICKTIVKEINNSKTSIDMALYEVNKQKEIVNALKNAKQRGVKIRAVCNYSKKSEEEYPDTGIFVKDFNAVVDDDKTFMHNKFFVFDDKKVLTGSVNISASGTGGYNANIAILIESGELAKIYKEEFDQMYSGKFSISKRKFEHEPVNIDKTTINSYFSPKNDVFNKGILPLIKNAKRKIYVSAFYLTERNLINELVAAKKRNVEVVIIMDAVGAINFKERISYMRSSGIPLKVENWGGKNHEKTIMIDDEYLILGSCNFSINGFYKNDENTLVIKNPEIAKYYADYFLYLFNSIDNKYLKFIPRAESLDSYNSCFDGIDNNFDGKIDSEDEGCKKY